MERVLAGLNTELESLVEKARQSLVRVGTPHGGGGAGVVLHRRGLIVTNAHVVWSRHLEIGLPDGRTVAAEVVSRSRGLDLALLRAASDGLTPLPLGDSDRVRPGEWVLALGHPWGVNGAVAAGVVTSVDGRPDFLGAGPALLELSLPLRPGHSGGPLLDTRGRLIGINRMIAGPERSFAIPVNAVKRLLNRVLS